MRDRLPCEHPEAGLPGRAMTGLAHYLVIDDFLAEDHADRLLEQMLGSEARFTPAEVRQAGRSTLNADFRSALRLPGRIGVDLTGFVAAIHERFDDLCRGTGVSPFPIYHTECSVVANRGGDFYKRHVDTGAAHRGYVRVVSSVYYLNRRPRPFTGGELALYPLTGAEPPARIEPRHNRLAVFPAFVPHEVLPTICPGGEFADSRFSINCWLHREVKPAPAAQ